MAQLRGHPGVAAQYAYYSVGLRRIFRHHCKHRVRRARDGKLVRSMYHKDWRHNSAAVNINRSETPLPPPPARRTSSGFLGRSEQRKAAGATDRRRRASRKRVAALRRDLIGWTEFLDIVGRFDFSSLPCVTNRSLRRVYLAAASHGQ